MIVMMQSVLGFLQKDFTIVVRRYKMILGDKRTVGGIVILVVLLLLVGQGHQLPALMDTMVEHNVQMIVVMFLIDIAIVTLRVLHLVVLQEQQRQTQEMIILQVVVQMLVVNLKLKTVIVKYVSLLCVVPLDITILCNMMNGGILKGKYLII
jgi:hypothetical protein